MDPALLKQRQEFMMQAIKSMDTMKQIRSDGQNQASTISAQSQPKKKKKKAPAPSTSANAGNSELSEYRAENAAANVQQNAANFSIMAKIVDYMKKRHLNLQQWPLTAREILDEMQIYDINKKTLLWLNEALPLNPRLQTEEDDKFSYKPPHRVKNKVTLLALLKKHHTDGKGGILLSELNECVANAEGVAKSLGAQIIAIPTQINKRKDTVYFYNDDQTDYALDEEFVQLWRVAGVEHLDENKIEEYLAKHSLDAAKDLIPRKAMAAGAAPKRKQPRQRTQQKVHNVHLDGVLEEYVND